MYQKILLAFDGTTVSQKALEHAVSLATLSKAELLIVHALVVPRLANRAPAGAAASTKATLEDNGKTLVAEAVEKAQSQGVKVHGMLIDARPSKAILYAIYNERPDLVVMGSRGDLISLSIGSTTRKVMHDSPVPVMVVK